jgi:hypothetical protein
MTIRHLVEIISTAQYEFVQTDINNTGKMLGGWIKSCKA